MEFKILDHGFIRLVDFMGGDTAIVQAARVSFGQGSKGEERDRKLIDFLIRNKHETPFEQSVFKFHVKCPIFVARQWFRHRWSSFNEISGRYTEMKDEFYVPEKFRIQKSRNYDYEDIPPQTTAVLHEKLQRFYSEMYALYESMIAEGVAKEQARIVLPLALYTQFYWAVNARSLMNFLMLRLDVHAQLEIRLYAQAIKTMFQEKLPWTYDSFKKHILDHEITS
jgi:thymidylate synthase (FAD)